jgi:hypothetical protein
MISINQPDSFSKLQEFYIPAIHHQILVRKKKMYSLSIPLEGNEIQIKRSASKIKHTSFAKVILGSVLRMQKLFNPDKIKLGVIINKRPSSNDMTLEFELVNLNKFVIGDEEYFITIVANYSYSQTDKVVYYPILYRQWCINGAVCILSEQFKEVIAADKILEIGCEWTRCNFESYKNRANSYFQYLRRRIDSTENLLLSANQLADSIFNLRNQRPKSNRKKTDVENFTDTRSVRGILSKYIEHLGSNYFAVYNALTEYASHEHDLQLRYQYMMSIGKYLSKELSKTAKMDKERWSETMDWKSLNRMISM